MQDPGGAMVDVVQKVYGLSKYHPVPQALQDKFALEPLLPAFLLKPFYVILGPSLIILGITLLLGIATRISLFLQGILYIILTIGLMLINQNDGVSWLGIASSRLTSLPSCAEVKRSPFPMSPITGLNLLLTLLFDVLFSSIAL